jgi:putative nucleotidyltransferase with HDIG domain
MDAIEDVGVSGWQAEVNARVKAGQLAIPVFPSVATDIAKAVQEERDPRHLAEIVRRDGSVSAHLLRLANSPMFRGRETIVTAQQAIARLGTQKLRQVSLIVALESRTFNVPGYEPLLKDVLRHGFAAACFAQQIARARASNAEDAFLCALMHDLGRPILLQAALDAGAVIRAEILAFVNASHTSVGAAIATGWSLPPSVASAIATHHGDDSGAAVPVHIVRLADELAHFAFDPSEQRAQRVRAHHSLQKLEIYPERVEALLASAPSVSATTSEVIG